MSWDVLLQKFPDSIDRPDQTPEEYLPPALGSRAEVAAVVRKVVRNVDFASESFITIDRSRFAIEIDLGDDEPCSQLLLHVHDDHIAATKLILRLADHLKLRAIDCSTSEFIEAGPSKGRRTASYKQLKDGANRRSARDGEEARYALPLESLPGVTRGPCDRYVYLSLHPKESPKQLHKSVFKYWLDLTKEHGEMARISGPSLVLTLPDGEALGDFHVRWYPALVTETESELIAHVQKGAALVHAFAGVTGRQCGEIENGSTFVGGDGRRVPLTECVYRKLLTDADYGKKNHGTKKK